MPRSFAQRAQYGDALMAPVGDAGTEYKDLQVKIAAARARVKKLSQVNRHLHTALADKQILAQDLKQQVQSWERRIEAGNEVELPERHNCIDALEDQIEAEQRIQQSSNLELGRGAMEMEERVGELAAVNAKLREASTRNRALLKEQLTEIRERQTAIRDMQRHIQIMEGGDVTVPTASEPRAALRGSGSTTSLDAESQDKPRVEASQNGNSAGASRTQSTDPPFAGGSPRGELKSIDEYRQLPGLDIQKLLGHAATTVASPGASAQSSRGG